MTDGLEHLDRILIHSSEPGFGSQIEGLRRMLAAEASFEPGSDGFNTVMQIVQKVIREGDAALIEYTRRFDASNFNAERLRVSEQEMRDAHARTDPALLDSLRRAIDNVRTYQSAIFIGDRGKADSPGLRYTPIRRVGVCVPGASAPLPSTVIMTAVPAQVAGVEEIAVVSPPRYHGTIHPVILAVCHELGIREVYRVGGAQAVAAMAAGTRTIPRVDKIVGPGNTWVQTAKKLVAGSYVGIDSIAGPSEVLIVANDQARPAWVAADMLSQAEHAPGSAIVATDSADLARAVLEELKKQVVELPRGTETVRCLLDYSKIIVFDAFDAVIDFANACATEHLEIQCGEADADVAKRIVNAGAMFIGPYSPVAVGDYWAGPSHTLPTGTTARFYSAVTSNDFVKSTSIIACSAECLARDGEHIIRLARTEGLDAHARSIEIRRGT